MIRGISRRDFARSLASAGIALPFLRVLGIDPLSGREALAATTTPKRVIFVYIPNGYIEHQYATNIAGGSGTTFTFGNMTSPLAPLKSDVVMLNGVQMADSASTDRHTTGMVAFLTCNGFLSGAGGNGNALGVHNASIDQYLASKVGSATPFPSVQLGVQPTSNYYQGGTISFSDAGKGKGLPGDPDPANVFKKLFANVASTGGAGTDPNVALRDQLRKSVLDNVVDDIGTLRGRLGTEDQAKLDQQLTSVRAMETQLGKGGGSSVASCTKGAAPVPGNLQDSLSYPAITSGHLDVLYNSFACDLTRIATIQFRACYSQFNTSFAPLAYADDIHDQSHNHTTAPAGQTAPFVNAINWHYQQLAAFATKLKNTKEIDGNGTMLDNTIIVTGSDIGGGHFHQQMGMVSIGGKGMGVKTGQMLTFGSGMSNNAQHANLYVSILNAFGVNDTNFGGAATGPLAGYSG